ncbi:MAG: UPF0158 family protein [Bacteroidales bacterium]|jgi:hypothetical protein|nr:hypothetical protein [Bacteroidales bacterium]MBS3774978.1 hypothetical protein [Bacteroidales bacterium]
MKINKKQTLDIAKRLENGNNVYLNKDTGEYKSLPDVDEFSEDNDFNTDELRKITDHWENYMIFTRMEPWEIFEMMEEFIYKVDREFQNKLLDALYQHKPFDNFQHLVETSKYRDDWFAFKDEKYTNYVMEQLQAEGIDVVEPGEE